MNLILDIIGSTIVRSAMVAVVLTLIVNLHNALYKKTEQSIVKQNLVSASQVLSNDVRLAGYNAAAPAFLTATKEEMRFTADIDQNGIVDTVWYYVDPIPPGQSSTYHRSMYRKISSGSALEIARDIVGVTFTYRDIQGASTTDVSKIKSVAIVLSMEYSFSLDGEYQRGTWEREFFPENL